MEDRRPRARQEQLLIETLGDELLVYDADSNQAHALNARASAIWRACDGTRSVEALAQLAGVSQDDAWSALTQLSELNLLSRSIAAPPSHTRRAVLRRGLVAGGAGVAAVPIIRTVVAPSRADAASATCTPDNQPCDLNNPGACCSQTCCNFSPPNPPVCCF